MYSEGVLVQVKHPIFGTSKGSGLQINNIVIAHGSIFEPLCCACDEDFFKQYNILMEDLKNLESKGLYQSGSDDLTMRFKVLRKVYSHKDSGKTDTARKCKPFDNEYTVEEARLFLLHDYTAFSDIRKEISHWTCNDKENGCESHHLMSLFLPKFIFLMFGSFTKSSFKKILFTFYNIVKHVLFYPGLPLVVESTPFANFSLINSWSHGIVSKVIGTHNDGILTDARLVYGCEGAPMYIYKDGLKGALVGLVIQTISWYNGEWIGFSLGLSIKHLLGAVLEQSAVDYLPFNVLNPQLPPSEINIDQLSSAIVFVRCQHKWGTGVVFEGATGLILTCSHIINHDHESVIVLCESGHFPATVVYASPLSSPYDLALLSVGSVRGLQSLPLADDPPIIGERVIIAGYPLSLESLVTMNRTPTLSAGCVAKISSRGGPLQTTCCTQSGASGGAVIRPPCYLLGIVVSNVRMDTTTFPSFSFAVAIEDIKDHIFQYMKTNDPACLESLCVENYGAKMEWALMDCKL